MKETRGRSGRRSGRGEGATRSARQRDDGRQGQDDDGKGSQSSSSSSSSSEEPPGARTCVSPAKSEDSEGGNATDLSASSGGGGKHRSDSPSSSGKKSGCANIPFQPGLRLEAKDLGSEIWYTVKVVEVDWEEDEILIHFEKWSQRYDEWIPMDSSRLRPLQEPSTGVVKKNKVFAIGDSVMATWSDSRKYLAKVKSVLPGDRYEVVFYDGFTKNIRGARMTKAKESDMLNAEQFDPEKQGMFKALPKTPAPPVLSPLVTDADAIGTKADRRERKRKLNVAELFHFKKRPRLGSRNPVSEKQKAMVAEGRRQRLVQQRPSRGRLVDSADSLDDDVQKVKVKVEEPDDFLENSVNAIIGADRPYSETKKKEEGEGKSRRKMVTRTRGKEEEERSKRRSKVDESEEHGRAVPRRNVFNPRMARKVPRRVVPEDRVHVYLADGLPKEVKVKKEPVEEVLPAIPEAKSKKKEDVDGEKPRKLLDTWEPEGQPAYVVESAEGLRKSIIVQDKRLPPGWIKHMIQRKGGHSAGKWDVFFVSAQGRKFRSRHELRNYFEEQGEEFNREQFDFSLGRRKMRLAQKNQPEGTADKPVAPDKTPRPMSVGQGKAPSMDAPVVRRVKTLLPKVRVSQPVTGEEMPPVLHSNAASPAPSPSYVTPPPLSRMMEDDVPVGAFKIQVENDAFMCPKDGCHKHFRKENLLQMHIKHYHPEYNKFMGSTPNVADLAYARTIGEPVEDLMPKARYSVASPAFLEKINRFEEKRKAKSGGGSLLAAASSPSLNAPAVTGGDGGSPSDKKKPPSKDGKQLSSSAGFKKMGKSSDGDGVGPLEEAVADGSEQKAAGPQKQDGGICPADGTTPLRDDHRKEQTCTIKTLLPVVRASGQELSLADRLKMRFPHDDCDSRSSMMEGSPCKELPGASHLAAAPSVSHTPVNQTKSSRTVRRKHMNDFHMEPVKKRKSGKLVLELASEDGDVAEEGSLTDGLSLPAKSPTAYRFSRKKPVVHLEKLPVTTDSNGDVIVTNLAQVLARYHAEREERGSVVAAGAGESIAKARVEQLRREEIINCTCGYSEEDGLMIQCDLCLCWQHGLCNNIEKETDVPDKYVCPICLNPPRERFSRHYLHDQDWLKEGTLPSFSFRSKNRYNVAQRESILKRSHDLTATLLQLEQVIHSLRVKVNIAEKADHPKLYLWAKSWEKSGPEPLVTPAHGRKGNACDLGGDTPATGQHAADPVRLSDAVGELSSHLDAKGPRPFADDVKPALDDIDTSSQDSTAQISEVKETQVEPKPLLSVAKKTASEVSSQRPGREAADAPEWNLPGSFSARDLTYAMPEDIYGQEESESSLDRYHVALSDDEATSSEQQQANLSDEEEPRRLGLSEDEERSDNTPADELAESVADDADTKDTVTSVESVEGAPLAVSKPEGAPALPPAKEDTKSDMDLLHAMVLESTLGIEMETTEVATEVEEAHEETVELQEQTVEVRDQDGEAADDKLAPGGHILHQALTTGVSPPAMLQLPICQSELMQLATSMADDMASAAEPLQPTVPQPEAPIDPVECRLTLLDHIDHYHQIIDSRLMSLEAQIAALESLDPHVASDEAADYYPQTKQTVQMLMRDLSTVRRIAALN